VNTEAASEADSLPRLKGSQLGSVDRLQHCDSFEMIPVPSVYFADLLDEEEPMADAFFAQREFLEKSDCLVEVSLFDQSRYRYQANRSPFALSRGGDKVAC
jgi:hypothetical protein